MKNKYSIGNIVTFKTHPLLYDLRIKGDGKFVPPFMVIKQVFFEDKKKQIADDKTGEIIAERIKYICIYFDDNKSEFKEATIYESMLESFENIFIGRVKEFEETEKEAYVSFLISEAKGYVSAKYIYGNIVYFKTKKLKFLKKKYKKHCDRKVMKR